MGASGRRSNGQGSVYRRVPDPGRPNRKGWIAVLTVGWTPDGETRRVSRTANTEAEAFELLGRMLAGDMPAKQGRRRVLPIGSKWSRKVKRSAPVGVSSRVRFMILERDGFACHYCGARPPDAVLHVDHLIPRSKGGSDEPENLISACQDCNLGKGDL